MVGLVELVGLVGLDGETLWYSDAFMGFGRWLTS